ncbi:MAG: DUF5131 family protein, partial [Patescibacteria group bacterium]|nr:DUF5131 family protein [Patescibacteria group bacterium]
TKRPENIPVMWPAIDRDHADTNTLLANHFRAVDARIKAGGLLANDPIAEHVAFQNELSLLAYRPNCWLGTSIAVREDAERNIPLLRKCRELAPVLFLSIEPLLEDVGQLDLTGIDLVIVGCESNGSRAGRFQDGYEAAARSINRQCKAAGVSVFNKQMPIGGLVSESPEEFPEDLRVRQFPKLEAAR